MQLDFKKINLGYTSTTERQTLKVLPLGKGADASQGQRVVVGDTSGVLQSFFFQNGAFQQVYKTVPGPRKICSVVTGQGPTQKDRAFVAEGSVIKGFDRKGNQFFRFTTPMTEDIQHVAVHNRALTAFSEHGVTFFEDTTEKGYYEAPDRINCSTIAPLSGPDHWLCVIGCQDRTIRVLKDASVTQEISFDSAVTAVEYFALPHDVLNQHPTRHEIFYGLADGEIGQLFLSETECHRGARLPSDHSRALVTAIFSGFDLTKDGLNDIVVGREDGNFEIYDMDNMGALQLCWQANVGQSINTIDGGTVSSPTDEEYVVQTFSGQVLSFTSGSHTKVTLPAGNSSLARPLPAASGEDDVAGEIAAAEADIRSLQAQAEECRRALLAKSSAMVATKQVVPVQHSLRINTARKSHELVIEASAPIFCVAVASTLPVQLLDSPSSVAIVSESPPMPGSDAQSLVTYRCQDSTVRVVIAMRLREGAGGKITAFVVPRSAPKTCAVISYSISTLSMHRRIHEPDASRPYTHLHVTGDLAATEMHKWIGNCLPETPKYLPTGGRQVRLVYESALVGTHLVVTYGDGEASLSSDNVCTMAILREALTKQATAAGVHIKMAKNLEKDTVVHFVGLVWPKLQLERKRALQLQLLDALENVNDQEADSSFLTPEMKQLLDDRKAVREAAETTAGDDMQQIFLDQIRQTWTEWCWQRGLVASEQQKGALERLVRDTHSKLEDALDFILHA